MRGPLAAQLQTGCLPRCLLCGHAPAPAAPAAAAAAPTPAGARARLLRPPTCPPVSDAQEREKRGESWAPRWFKALPADAEALPGEYGNDECPQFEFTGDYLQLEQRPPSSAKGAPQARTRAAAWQGLLGWSRPGAAGCMHRRRLTPRASAPAHSPPRYPSVHLAPTAEEVQGAGFSPWCYPDLHPQLGKETQRA